MSATQSSSGKAERRAFPRINAQCAIRFSTHSQSDWQHAELENYSAAGLCMLCDSTLLVNTQLTLQLMPGDNKLVPPMSAEAVVVRCQLDEDHHYQIACKLTKVRQAMQ